MEEPFRVEQRADEQNCRALACERLQSACNRRQGNGERAELYAALWTCIRAFEHAPFVTTSGLPFTYTFKPNRYGEKGNEILVSRKEKTITPSSVEKAFDRILACGMPLPAQMSTPKELDVFGASYLYPLFMRFGIVEHIGGHRRGGRRPKVRREQEGQMCLE